MSCISPTSRQPLFVVVFLSRASTGHRETPASPATDDVIFIIPQALFPRLRWFPNIRSGAVPSEVRKTVKLSASTHSVSSFRFNCLRPQLSLNTTSHQQKKKQMASRATRYLTPVFRSGFRSSQTAFRASGRRGMATTASPSTRSSDLPWIVRALRHAPRFS